MPKSLFNPTCAWLILAGIFRSPKEFLLGTMPVAVIVGGGCVARPREADCGEVGVLVEEAFGVMDGGGDGSDFASKAGRRSSDSRPGASDSEEEMMERSEAIDLRGSSASCSRGGDGGWSSIGGSS
jgi:hypothetical protein